MSEILFYGAKFKARRVDSLWSENSQQVSLMEGEEQYKRATVLHDERCGTVKAVASTPAAMGVLAASIGHEFNNPLGYVCSSIDYCKNYLLKLGEKARLLETFDAAPLREEFAQLVEAMHDAQEGLSRMTSIMTELQGFTNLRALTFAPVSVGALMVSLLKRAKYEGLNIHYISPDCLAYIHGDVVQLTQALENILDNAWQATAAHETNAHLPVELGYEVTQGKVMVRVSDQGVGMREELLRTMFDPFVTTRNMHGRVGLGLTLAHQVIVGHGGEVFVRSEPGRGTCLMIMFDEVMVEEILTEEGLVDESTLNVDSTLEEDIPLTTGATILIVSEDSESCQDLASMLIDAYDVSVVSGTADALDALAQRGEIACVLFDMDVLDDEWQAFHDALSEEDARHLGVLMGGLPDMMQRQFLERHHIPVFSRPFRQQALLPGLGRLARERSDASPQAG